MLSLKLWRALHKPPRRHPLYQYVLEGGLREDPRVTSGFVVWTMMLAGALFVWSVLYRPMLIIILAFLVALNSIYAVRWVIRIAETILSEKEKRRYDLLAALPTGLLGISWAISTGAVHKRSSFRWLPYVVLMTAVIAFLALCGLTTTTLALLDSISDNETMRMAHLDFIRIGVISLPFVIMFYIDHVYSILTAILFGQIATIDIQNPAEGRVRAFLGFLAVQATIYLITIVGVVAFSALRTYIGLNAIEHLLIVGIVGMMLFILLREVIVHRLWHFLIQALEADANEQALVLKPFYQAEHILRESEKARARYLDTSGSVE